MMLHEKVCLVTGASRGIGAATALRFAQEGATVYASARNEEALENLSKSADGMPGAIMVAPMDVCDGADRKSVIMRIKKEQGQLDVLVNNAGIMKDALMGMISASLMQETFDTNVFALLDLMQLASKLMVRQGSGSIINISSLVGTNGNKNQLVYSASKGAVISATKSASKELAPKGIRVNAIAPGIIDTDLLSATNQETLEKLVEGIALGRLGSPQDVANVCVFFASDLSSYVTGQILGVDGGALM